MATTQFPTKSDYERAVEELKKLNEDIFYDDFKEKIRQLESNIHTHQSDIVQKNQEFLGTVSHEISEFTQKLSFSDERNRQFLKQNEAFVTFTKEQLAGTEEKLAVHMTALQEMDARLQQLHQSYEEMFQMHSHSIKSILVVREEALINKLTHQLDHWAAKQLENDESLNRNVQQMSEQLESIIQAQNKKSNELLLSFEKKMSSKEDLANVEKKNKWRTNLLLFVVVIEAIFIGLNFFM